MEILHSAYTFLMCKFYFLLLSFLLCEGIKKIASDAKTGDGCKKARNAAELVSPTFTSAFFVVSRTRVESGNTKHFKRCRVGLQCVGIRFFNVSKVSHSMQRISMTFFIRCILQLLENILNLGFILIHQHFYCNSL